MGLKKFPNLFPKDSPRIIQRSRLVLKEGKWREVTSKREERTASGVYNFIVKKPTLEQMLETFDPELHGGEFFSRPQAN